MKKIKTLTVLFDNELRADDIPKFRGAVLGKVDQPDLAFHNHIGNEKFVYDYPKIQYKSINKKASLFCIEEGIGKLSQFFNVKNKTLNLNGKSFEIVVENMLISEVLVHADDKYYTYYIQAWLALNEKNFELYKKCNMDEEKKYFLENILRANILSFGKGVDCLFENEIRVQITEIKKEYLRDFKGVKMHTINAEFKTNVSLPENIGLGKGVSIGFGVVSTIVNK